MKKSSHNNTVNYFNAHTNGLGYLNSIKRVEPRSRDNFDAFISLSFCELEGNPDNPKKKYISLTIANPAIETLLAPYWDDINDDDVKVFCKLRYSDALAKPFMYGDQSAKAGQLGVNYSAKAISMSYLKIGEQDVELPDAEPQAKAPEKRASRESAKASPQRRPQAQSRTQEVRDDDLPFAVKLGKNDREFDRIKARLKREGYWFHNELNLWCLPAVQLSSDDPEFGIKEDKLFELGYQQDHVDLFLWKIEFPKYQNTQSSRQSYQQSPRRSA